MSRRWLAGAVGFGVLHAVIGIAAITFAASFAIGPPVFWLERGEPHLEKALQPSRPWDDLPLWVPRWAPGANDRQNIGWDSIDARLSWIRSNSAGAFSAAGLRPRGVT